MCFEEPNSYVHLSGRHIYVGSDAAKARASAYAKWVAGGRLCGICGQRVVGEPDWDHIIPKGPHGCDRDDHPRNRQFVHSMFGPEPCHREKHNREVRWSKRELTDGVGT